MQQYTAIDMAKRLIIDSIWKSANLEGLGTTFPKTEAIIENAPTETKSEEVLFVINMKRAWQFLLDNLNCENDIAILREYNKIVGNMMFNYAGEIRTFSVYIGGTSWQPDIPQLDSIMQALKEINTIEDAETRALKFFCYVTRTQMFPDGNKRVAQLIANKILINDNIGVFQIPIDKLEEFKTLLVNFYETNNDTNIIEFMRGYCIRRL